jgi:hypothetical protein
LKILLVSRQLTARNARNGHVSLCFQAKNRIYPVVDYQHGPHPLACRVSSQDLHLPSAHLGNQTFGCAFFFCLSWQEEQLMGYPPRPYVNCHFCNAKLSLGLGRLIELRRPRGLLLQCQACSNQDIYEASMIRDALLLPTGAGAQANANATATATAPVSADPETAAGLGRLGS